ncbi:hypothetical protein E2562_026878 [Oryza meyeriana var. granulata]|uniref:Uncharacterized protein n=1 Tax=Oryza meyeriana var. granulata TaxID=110450 RepID=A0A6G1EPP1_9ORYZ|nr:hypothetical protein E2562_026878 [Oryza meyeriana var. granulata]
MPSSPTTFIATILVAKESLTIARHGQWGPDPAIPPPPATYNLVAATCVATTDHHQLLLLCS